MPVMTANTTTFWHVSGLGCAAPLLLQSVVAPAANGQRRTIVVNDEEALFIGASIISAGRPGVSHLPEQAPAGL